MKELEDCFLDGSDPANSSDPWAVHPGRSGMQLTYGRQKLYDLVQARGTISFPEAAN